MKNTTLLNVDLQDSKNRSYDIAIGEGILTRAAQFLPFDITGRNVFVLTDENVTKIHAMPVYKGLRAAGAGEAQLLALPAGEETKSLEQYQNVISWLLSHNMNRDSVLFAVGGGVIGDLGGFAAATAMRGIDYVQVPTTLLAQVDSAVGGKTGINGAYGKNLVGAFHQPAAVICDLETLQTLPRRELLAGYAEIVKYGLLGDASFFKWLEKNYKSVLGLKTDALTHAIQTSCKAKADIVAKDEFERSGMRALLNLGHTFAHALESAAVYDGRLLHGEAVAIGMVLAFRLSHALGLCDEREVHRVEKHMAAAGLPTDVHMVFPPLDTDSDTLLKLMSHDKKNTDGRITFILVKAIGQAFVEKNTDLNIVKSILNNSLKGAG